MGSRSVPLIGPIPWRRVSTTSESSTPISGMTLAASLSGSNSTPDLRAAAKMRALSLEPAPSARRSARQWITGTPAARAPFASRAAFGIISARAASASWGKIACSPMTPF